MKSDFYLHLSSADSKEYFPENKSTHFTVKLPEVLHLEGEWRVSLCELFHPSVDKPQFLWLLTDVCDDTIIDGKKLPLLRIFQGKKRQAHVEFTQLHYKSVNKETIERITVYIRSDNGEAPSFSSETLRCTLHFQPLK